MDDDNDSLPKIDFDTLKALATLLKAYYQKAVPQNPDDLAKLDNALAIAEPVFKTAEAKLDDLADSFRAYHKCLCEIISEPKAPQITESDGNLRETKSQEIGATQGKQIFEKLTQLIPELEEWTVKASRHDEGTPDGLKFKAPGMMDLNVDLLDRGDTYCRIALSHYYRHPSGDMIADPDMEVVVDFKEQTAQAATYQDAIAFERVIEGDKDCPLMQRQLDDFLASWLANIHNQGFELQPEESEQESETESIDIE